MNAQDQMFELVDVVRVEPRGGYCLALGFSEGTEGERDFADMIAECGEIDSIALHMEMKERGLLRSTAA